MGSKEGKKQIVKNEISTHLASRTNVTELDVTKFESLQQELRELKQLLKDKSFDNKRRREVPKSEYNVNKCKQTLETHKPK